MKTLFASATVAALLISGCGSTGDSRNLSAAASAADTHRESAAASSDLPVTQISIDETGPGSVAETFAQSDAIVLAELTSVAEAARIYGSGEDDPNPMWWEEVSLYFSPITVFKGTTPDGEVTIPWTAYERSSGEPSGERTATVETAGLLVNEDDIGKQYLLFLRHYPGEGLNLVNLSGGFVEVADDGTIVKASPQGVLRELEGQKLGEVIPAPLQ